MPKYKVLKDRVFGEGYAAGEIISLDENAARVRVELGHLELVSGDDMPSVDPEQHVDEPASGELDTAIVVFKEAATIMNKIGMRWWLAFGTALGAYRDGGFCEGDHDDIDFGLDVANYDKRKDIIGVFLVHGFEPTVFEHEDGIAPEISFKKNGVKIDLFFFTPKGKDYLVRIYKGDECHTYKQNKAWFSRLRKVEMYGETVRLPYAIKKYLENNYGDWETPVSRDNWDWYNSNRSPQV